MLTYAVGDIHGCRALLTPLLAAIERHAGGAERSIVFLGDYIDRGPDSAGVVADLRALVAEDPARVVCLKGNHEELCLQAAAEPRLAALWLANGGLATLASYGVGEAARLPADALRWMANLPVLHRDAHRCFVHAGLSPARPIDRQDPHDLLWIREPFLEEDRDFGAFVVHGHTPQIGGLPDRRRFRVNLDTAAVFGGRLTAAVFDGDAAGPVEYLQASPADGVTTLPA